MQTKDIENTIKELKRKIYDINRKNWIQSRFNGTGAAGQTLELLLGKEMDKSALPDYKGIEIKTKQINNNFDIGLFNMALDSKPLEMKKLLYLVGYKDKINPQFKVLQTTIMGNQTKKIGNRLLKIKINYEKKKLFLFIYDTNLNLIDNTMSWSFEQMKIILETKLNYLLLVPVKTYTMNKQKYFKYFNGVFYKLKDFSYFLKAIEEGIISITFKISYRREKEYFGLMKDHGTSFGIKKENLEKIFEVIDK